MRRPAVNHSVNAYETDVVNKRLLCQWVALLSLRMSGLVPPLGSEYVAAARLAEWSQ